MGFLRLAMKLYMLTTARDNKERLLWSMQVIWIWDKCQYSKILNETMFIAISPSKEWQKFQCIILKVVDTVINCKNKINY